VKHHIFYIYKERRSYAPKKKGEVVGSVWLVKLKYKCGKMKMDKTRYL